jgi:thioredoxin
LSPLAVPIALNAGDFDHLMNEARVPILVDFWAPWCGPCRAVAPHLETLARERAGKAIVAKVNVDENAALAARYGIQGIPNFGVFQNGKMVFQQAGAAPLPAMRGWIDKFV